MALPVLLLASGATAAPLGDTGDPTAIQVVGHPDPEGLLPNQTAATFTFNE